jgi:hypothetical protein
MGMVKIINKEMLKMSMVEMEKKKENMKKMVKIKEIYLRMRRK